MKILNILLFSAINTLGFFVLVLATGFFIFELGHSNWALIYLPFSWFVGGEIADCYINKSERYHGKVSMDGLRE